MKTIRVIISPTGEVTVDTKGFSGQSCREASKFLEEALGTRTNEALKAEFHVSETAHHTVQQRAS
ncbi:MAG TPA: DUF2997 domain-containing protein [Pirellulales bacterium]|nr:DUF2997 domain-containing protein [Pirellulales bacterium]